MKQANDMIHDLDMMRGFYAALPHRVEAAARRLGRPLTLTEKLLHAHLYDAAAATGYRRGEDYAAFRPDRVAMQDATAQMALLQFMNAGREATAVPATVHCDHLVKASDGAAPDLAAARTANSEVYAFLQAAASRYGLGYWRPGSGIIHQVVLENYAFPGGMMVGTDSHTPNAGGLGMLAVGVGGADAVDVMTGMAWELKMPRIIGVRLTGRLSGWCSPKDVILHLAGLLTVKGATNAVLEYFGPGAATLSCTGKATICNMGAEVGATTSVFPYDEAMGRYLRATGRDAVARMADAAAACLRADGAVEREPAAFYDRVIDVDLSRLTPHVNGPFTPDAACPVERMAERVRAEGYPAEVDVCLIGSCTNSSYEDLARAASVASQAAAAGLTPRARIIVNPGSEQIRATAERDGILPALRRAGAMVMANACGPCIGQWQRKDMPSRPNTIVTTFNRNFAKRADGNPLTHAFIVSPEMAVAYAYAGRLDFDPVADALTAADGTAFRFGEPVGTELPAAGFAPADAGYVAPVAGSPAPEFVAGSERLARLEPFAAPGPEDFAALRLLVKTWGKCTTDHISMAGPWLRFRGHLPNISRNLLMGAVNAFTGATNAVALAGTGRTVAVSEAAQAYRDEGCGSFVVAEDNYGEGSSREHAAMEPRYLGVRLIVAKSFARIHETNLKKQGVLALTFAEAADYDRVREGDRAAVEGLDAFAPGSTLTLRLTHADGTCDVLPLRHTYNAVQIGWFRAGSALNALRAAASRG